MHHALLSTAALFSPPLHLVPGTQHLGPESPAVLRLARLSVAQLGSAQLRHFLQTLQASGAAGAGQAGGGARHSGTRGRQLWVTRPRHPTVTEMSLNDIFLTLPGTLAGPRAASLGSNLSSACREQEVRAAPSLVLIHCKFEERNAAEAGATRLEGHSAGCCRSSPRSCQSHGALP